MTEIGDRGGEIRGARMGPPPRLIYKPNFYFQEVTYMSRMAVIYWSMTGNTEAMANAIAEGAAGAGAEVDVKQVCDTTVDEALGYGLLALGCPAMGAEVLEEAEFEPFWAAKRWLCSAPTTGATVSGCGTGPSGRTVPEPMCTRTRA